jgi:hypothetical protein
MVVRELYRKYREEWLLEYLFDDLLAWNRWYAGNREIGDGLMAWGTRPYAPLIDNFRETAGVGGTYGAAMESGMDNSPMYDGVPVNPKNHCMVLADVGLTSLYIMDCAALKDIALAIGRNADAEDLGAREEQCVRGLKSLWCEEKGIFLNRRMDTGTFSMQISPTNFYPLLTGSVSPHEADRMIREHFNNPNEFWGEWMLPSTPRNHPAYPEQNYWRGRIWPPMNFLVYLGLRRYDAADARRQLAEKSGKLLLKEWVEKGHIHENYNADNGEGCDVANSDTFYHWGALLSLIALMEAGCMEGPEGAGT